MSPAIGSVRSRPLSCCLSIALLAIAPLSLGGCAVGHGEGATGVVEISLLPTGDESGGVYLHEASMALLGIVGIGAEEDDRDPGDEQGHAHLSHAPSAPSKASSRAPLADGSADLAFPIGAAFPVELDLMGMEQRLGTLHLPAGSYEGMLLEFEDQAGCGLSIEGEAPMGGAPLPVTLCLPRLELELHIPFDLGLDERLFLRLPLDVHELLEGVDVSRLSPEEDGSILIDSHSNPFAAAKIEENLRAALER